MRIRQRAAIGAAFVVGVWYEFPQGKWEQVGAFFAAAAAWYRRFLALSSPNRNRNRRPSQAPKQRPGDGRTRTSSSQKAPAKR